VINNIIQWLADELTPADICQKLKFCNATLTAEAIKFSS
jgi:hypothetical protein